MPLFEETRNTLIKEGLIKDKPTSWCKLGPESRNSSAQGLYSWQGPCVACTTDAMCTSRDMTTGEIRHTFIKKYKKEHMVMK